MRRRSALRRPYAPGARRPLRRARAARPRTARAPTPVRRAARRTPARRGSSARNSRVDALRFEPERARARRPVSVLRRDRSAGKDECVGRERAARAAPRQIDLKGRPRQDHRRRQTHRAHGRLVCPRSPGENLSMRVALGSDMAGELPEAIDRWLRSHGHDVVTLRRARAGRRRRMALGRPGGRANRVAGGDARVRRALLLDRNRRQHRSK